MNMDVMGQESHVASRNRAMSIDSGAIQHTHTHRSQNMPPPGMPASATAAAFAIARSPPKPKNTSHVPCKFFPYGTCQAGNACQFSHDLSIISQVAPCKYFTKGSCKFGHSCALPHILSDGRIVNRSAPRSTAHPPHGRRVTHLSAGLQSPTSYGPSEPYSLAEHQQFLQHQHETSGASSYNNNVPASPSVRPSQHNNDLYSPYGSPHTAQSLASPSRPGLSALDVPLPNSFDSQGISQAARHGPFASSMPPRFGFGFDSPPSSLPNKSGMPISPLREVHDSQFTDTVNLDGVLHGLGSSPRDQDSASLSKRSSLFDRYAGGRSIMSCSLDTRGVPIGDRSTQQSDDDEDSDEGVGEDLLPSSLHDLLPQDKLRRSSRSAIDQESSGFFATSPRRGFSTSNNTPTERSGNLSPIASSPSRYSAIWASRASAPRKTENEPSTSAFGHVGSPLRPSALRTSSSLASNTTGNSFLQRAPAKAAGQSNLSILTKELQRSRLSDDSTVKQSPLSLLATQNMDRDSELVTQSMDREREAARAEAEGKMSTNGSLTKKPEDVTAFSFGNESEKTAQTVEPSTAEQSDESTPTQSLRPEGEA